MKIDKWYYIYIYIYIYIYNLIFITSEKII